MATHDLRNYGHQDHWDALKSDYIKNGISLALGAGVSAGCNLPTWCELLERIAAQIYRKRGPKLVRKLMKEGYPLPSIASMLEIDCPSGTDFTGVIRNALYEGFPFYPNGVNNRTAFVKHVKTHNKTLSAVAALCVRRVRRSFIANGNIHAIVNSNFDATLRAYARARYHRSILRTVERPSAGFIRGRINMYHVHGFFQFDNRRLRPDEEAPEIRVLTEQEYYDFFNQPNSLFNYTFLYLLREYNVLFIGMSLMDENIRRLLHYSRTEIRDSYKKENETREAAEKKSLRHYCIQKLRNRPELNDIMEKSFTRLGVRVLWIQDFGQIPARLKELYETTGARWVNVY